MNKRGAKKKLTQSKMVSINLDQETIEKAHIVCKPNLSAWIRGKIAETYNDLPVLKQQADIFGMKK